jgi:uncharacterized protein (TIGR00369 family)
VPDLLDLVPFVGQAGITLHESGPGRAVVRLPFRRGNENHVGTLHAGALVLAAETAGGVACLSHPKLQGMLLLAKALSARYRRPAKGDCLAKCTLDEDAVGGALAAVEAAGKSDLQATSEVFSLDPSGGEIECVCTVTLTFHLRKPAA